MVLVARKVCILLRDYARCAQLLWKPGEVFLLTRQMILKASIFPEFLFNHLLFLLTISPLLKTIQHITFKAFIFPEFPLSHSLSVLSISPLLWTVIFVFIFSCGVGLFSYLWPQRCLWNKFWTSFMRMRHWFPRWRIQLHRLVCR